MYCLIIGQSIDAPRVKISHQPILDTYASSRRSHQPYYLNRKNQNSKNKPYYLIGAGTKIMRSLRDDRMICIEFEGVY